MPRGGDRVAVKELLRARTLARGTRASDVDVAAISPRADSLPGADSLVGESFVASVVERVRSRAREPSRDPGERARRDVDRRFDPSTSPDARFPTPRETVAVIISRRRLPLDVSKFGVRARRLLIILDPRRTRIVSFDPSAKVVHDVDVGPSEMRDPRRGDDDESGGGDEGKRDGGVRGRRGRRRWRGWWRRRGGWPRGRRGGRRVGRVRVMGWPRGRGRTGRRGRRVRRKRRVGGERRARRAGVVRPRGVVRRGGRGGGVGGVLGVGRGGGARGGGDERQARERRGRGEAHRGEEDRGARFREPDAGNLARGRRGGCARVAGARTTRTTRTLDAPLRARRPRRARRAM